MAPRLKYVDPTRPLGRFSRAFAAFSATRVGRLLSARVVWKVDPYLLQATGGRVGMTLVLPTTLLETRGAQSGGVRRNAVIYFHDSDRVTIIASKAGAEKHPAWFHNLLANPDVVFGGIPMQATIVGEEAERSRLWALADRVFLPFAAYRREAGTALPISFRSPSAATEQICFRLETDRLAIGVLVAEVPRGNTLLT